MCRATSDVDRRPTASKVDVGRRAMCWPAGMAGPTWTAPGPCCGGFFNGLDGDRSRPSVEVPFDPAHPLTTPTGINGDNPDVQRAFADAVQFFQANNIPFDVAIAQAQHYGGVSIPGCAGGEGCFDVVDPQALGSNGTIRISASAPVSAPASSWPSS